MNEVARIEVDIAYYDLEVQYATHYATETPPLYSAHAYMYVHS